MDELPPAVTEHTRPASSWFSKTVLLAALVGVIVANAIWQTGESGGPKYKGRRLSAWLNDMMHGSGVFHLTRDDFQAMGPEAVAWVAWAAEHGNLPPYDPKAGTRSKLSLAAYNLRLRFTHLREDPYYDERVVALKVLKTLGPDATPALPTLARIMSNPNPETYHSKRFVPDVLVAIGPTARPALDKVWQNADDLLRQDIMYSLDQQYRPWQSNGTRGRIPMSAEEKDWLEAFYLRALRNSGPVICLHVALALAAFQADFPGRPSDHAAIPVLVSALISPAPSVATPWFRMNAESALESFGPGAAPAIPEVLRLLDDPLATNRMVGARVLGRIDLVEKCSKAKLQELLADPSPQVQQAAKMALDNFEGVSAAIEGEAR